ncbi:unnamed protein product [Trichobilharzia szidati]|nr:unnamed protein product [Trichobilharzia szidati]
MESHFKRTLKRSREETNITVVHLILADPWGFVEDPLKAKEHSTVSAAQAWMFSTIRHIFRPFNPLSFLRAAGPFGPTLIHHFRQDLRGFFDQRPIRDGEILEIPPEEQLESTGNISFDDQIQSTDGEDSGTFEASSIEDKTLKTNGTNKSTSGSVGSLGFDDLDGSVALDYVYHINCQHPSGEAGFKSLCSSVGWPQRPMLERIAQLDASLPVTFIYGSRSWMDMSSGHKTRALRPNSYVDVKVIEGAGHQVYAQTSEEFNAYVNKIGLRVDNNDPFTPGDYRPHVVNNKLMNNHNGNTDSPSDNKGHNGRNRRKRSSVALGTQDTSLHLYGRLAQNGKPAAKNVEKGGEASDEASD